MLMLLFYVGDNRYAVEGRQVIEVIPMVKLKKQSYAPPYVAGVFNYRGQMVPVVDLCTLIQGSACCLHISTRIILVSYSLGQSLNTVIGLMAERVTETLDKQQTDPIESGVRVGDTPYLGEILADPLGTIQQLRIEKLFPEIRQSSLLLETQAETVA